MANGSSCIDHIVNQDTSLTFYLTDNIHHFTGIHLVYTTAFVNNRNRGFQKLCQFTSTSHSTMVWADNHVVRTNHTTTFKIVRNQGSTHQVIYWNIKESLNLCSMQINRQQTIYPSNF